MSGDYSRFTFDPRKRFAGVMMQQGRVQLDSDWNEQTDLLRERVRLLGLDAGGPAWVAYLTTPDAFLIGALAGLPPDLSIGAGRIYVDGRLAEIFPDESITYLNQPFLPTPDDLNVNADTIVYLDMWEREVSWAEDTELLDVALGGVDTTTRIQQIWQVKLHEIGDGSAECGIDLDALFPPSAGRLTTSAIAPPAPDDPCILPPNAGYRGIENRLYRVEIHVGGPLGTAQFKWSRDNGSIVSRVSAIAVAGAQSRVTVNRIGRDEVLRFRVGDWVTLTDDHRELNGEAGQMARVVDIDEAQRVVVLDRAVPTAGRAFGPTTDDLADRNTRLQRWDEQAPANVLNADGLMTTALGPIDLEDGVQASFSTSPAGGVFHVGDYWVFAARTADASVEPLDQAPPRGIRHQYLQLAAIPADDELEDCRPPQVNDEGCCTFVVRPGEDIQDAIDALPPEGGCICLKAGLHLLDEPLVLERDNVTLHGESMGAILFNRRGTGLLVVRQAMYSRIYNIVFRQVGTAAEPVIYLDNISDCTISDCRIETVQQLDSIGIFAIASDNITIADCLLENTTTGTWFNDRCSDIVVTGCTFNLPDTTTALAENVAVLAQLMSSHITVENNLINGAVNGIIINDNIGGQPASLANFSRISHNRLVMATNLAGQLGAFGIDAASAQTIVSENHIEHSGGRLTGIRLCGSGSSATGNNIVSGSDEAGSTFAVVAGYDQGGVTSPLERIAVNENIIEGLQNGIVLRDVAFGEVNGNILGRGGEEFGLGIVLDAAMDSIVDGNELERPTTGIRVATGARNTISGNRINGGGLGITIRSEQAPTITECRLNDLTEAGILMIGTTQRSTVTENRVQRCGSGEAVAYSIGALLVFGEWHVEANEVVDTGLPLDDEGPSAPQAIGVMGLFVLEANIESNQIGYTGLEGRNISNEDRALFMQGLFEYQVSIGDQNLVLGFAAMISNNKFVGTGASALVELAGFQIIDNFFLRFERVLFSNNYCWHFSGQRGDNDLATVNLTGRALTVSGNQVKAITPFFPSWQLNNRRGPFTGNISHGPTLGRNAANEFPSPENAFNMMI